MTVPDPAYALTPSGNLRRRMAVSNVMQGLATAAAVLAVAVLGILVAFVAVHGIQALSWGFVTGSLPPPTGNGNGIGPAILGTGEIVLFATLIAAPVGVLTALFLTEYAPPRIGSPVRLVIDVMAGVPTIVIGVFVYELLVIGVGSTGYAASVALSIVMMPLITRAALESLNRVPGVLREAADALGVSRWRTILGVVLPSATRGIVTATILAAARAAGETAPLLIVDSVFAPTVQLNVAHGIPNIPLTIFSLAEYGTPLAKQQAWGAGFVLLFLILAANIGARTLVGRGQRRAFV
jgi:phosphate transport system permease protein